MMDDLLMVLGIVFAPFITIAIGMSIAWGFIWLGSHFIGDTMYTRRRRK